MAADMDNPSALVQAGYTVQHLFTQYIQIPLKGFLRQFFSGFKIMLHFAEYPWAADAATSYHDSVYSYRSKHSLAPVAEVTSPFPMIGICIRGLFFTSPIRVQSASPVYICARVRP